jgi:hypothetical protein
MEQKFKQIKETVIVIIILTVLLFLDDIIKLIKL